MSCGRSGWPVCGDPALERDLEDGDTRLGGQARGWVGHAAPAQRDGERRGQRGELDQFALLKVRVRGDDGLPLPGVFAALLKQRAGGLERRGDRLDRRRGLGASATALTRNSCSAPAPANRTSRLSAKCRKNVRSVSPARSAISATVVCSNPRST